MQHHSWVITIAIVMSILAGGGYICADSATPNLEAQDDELAAIISIREPIIRGDKGGLAVQIPASGAVSGEVQYLEDPPRAFIDLPGAQCEPPVGSRYVGRGGVWRVRWAQFSAEPAIVRFVLDLQGEQQVRWQPYPEARGGALILGQFDGDEPIIEPGQPQLQAIKSIQDADGGSTIQIDLSLPVQWNYDVVAKPKSVELRLRDAQLPQGPLRQTVRSDFVRGIEAWATEDGALVKLYLRQLIRFEVSDCEHTQIRLSFRRDRLTANKVVIDPGHGGEDKGAEGRELLEKDVNLDVAMRVINLLLKQGVPTVMTRDNDKFVDLFVRPRVADDVGAAVFVSIHCNAMPRPDTNHGTETYYYTPQSQMLAVIMHQHLLQALGRKDNGVRRARFVVIRETQVPAVLVELMYLNYAEEELLLAQSEVRQAAAEAIVAGLQQYFEGEAVTTSLARYRGE